MVKAILVALVLASFQAQAFTCKCDYTYKNSMNVDIPVSASTSCPGRDPYKALCRANATMWELTAICHDLDSNQALHNTTYISGVVGVGSGSCYIQ